MRYALVIGNSEYEDHTLATLKTPITDVQELAKALGDPLLGEFDSVTSIVNQPEPVTRRGISQFLSQKKPDDLVLLYFSCHGILDDRGRLFLAVKDTQTELLKATGISASFITDEMDSCRSRRQVLILDCCYGGAFARGSKGSDKALTETTFEGSGYGRVVLTASDSTQFALEGDQVVDQAELSLFTHYLLNGLTSGEADLNNDGQVTLDELYDYTYLNVVSQTPRQTPCKWSYNQQGDLRISRNPNPVVIKPVELPPELREALENPYSSVRVGAVEALRRMLASSDPGTVLAARLALERLQTDDSRSVSEAAGRLLAEINKPAAAAEPIPKANAVIPPISESPPGEVPDSNTKANAAITPIPESAPLPGTKRQRKPAAPPEPTHLVSENIQMVNKAAAAQTAFQPGMFWAGWIGALLAGGVLLALEINVFKTIQPDLPIPVIFSLGLVGALTGGLQWWMLERKLAWAAGWLAVNIGIMVAVGAAAFYAYHIWDGLLVGILLIAWVGFNLIAGAMRALREFQAMPPGADQAMEDQRLEKSLNLRDWRIWIQWLGYPLGVVLLYLIGFDEIIKKNYNYYSYIFIFPLLLVSGGVSGLLQWSVLRQYRANTAAWVPLNVLALGIIAMLTIEQLDLQKELLAIWLSINLAVSAMLVLRTDEAAKHDPSQASVGRPSKVLFGSVWAGALLGGIVLSSLAILAIKSSGVAYQPGGFFAILAGVGAIVGLSQWLVLRNLLAGSWWWMIVNALWMGWVGYELAMDDSETSFGNTLVIAYLLVNLIFGITMYIWKTRQAKGMGKPESNSAGGEQAQ